MSTTFEIVSVTKEAGAIDRERLALRVENGQTELFVGTVLGGQIENTGLVLSASEVEEWAAAFAEAAKIAKRQEG